MKPYRPREMALPGMNVGPSLDELSQTVVTFGKYAGESLDNIPLSYLDWLNGQDWLREPLKSKLRAYLKHPTIEKALEKELGE